MSANLQRLAKNTAAVSDYVYANKFTTPYEDLFSLRMSSVFVGTSPTITSSASHNIDPLPPQRYF